MIEGLKPYAEYKESGLPWLDTVPKHWDMAPNRALMRDQRQVVGSRASDYTLLSLTLRGVIARDMVNPKGKFPAQFNTYKVVKPDDFVFCLFDIDETPRGVGLSPLKGMITGAYDIFSPTPRINPRFLYHYYLFVDEGKLMKPLYTGLRKTIQRGVFASLKAPLPPPDEQAAIVRFLDHANRKIDGFIRAKRKLIGLLNEQKQAIIHRAVTRGLDPEVPLKPSGIPWLGDIPKHWGTPRLAQLSTRIGDGLHGTPEYVDQSPYHFINGNNLVNGCIRLKASTRCVGLAEFKKHAVPLGESTLLMSINGTIGSVALYRGESVILGKSAAYINCNKSLTREYLLCFLQSPAVVNFLRQEVTGTTIFNLSLASIRGLPIALPSVDEQLSIVGSIEKNTAPTSTAIARTEREIALMQEYRTRLTADLVTGKLDVREAAAKLPDLPTDAAAPAEPLTDEAPEESETEEAEA